MANIEGGMRARIAEFLPCAIASALSSYQLFSHQENSGNTKSFKEHHDACKVAITHLELLIKLAKWADLHEFGDESDKQKVVLDTLIYKAKKELEKQSGDESIGSKYER